jgi:molecular chaperone DnaJ
MFSSSSDLYSILGVTSSASDAEIIKAFRRAAMKWHPDRNLTNVEESKRRFQEIQHAYSVLSDPHKRALYDAYGATAEPRYGRGADRDDARSYGFRTGAGSRGSAHGFRYGPQPVKGEDIEVVATVDVETLVCGGIAKVKVSFQDFCPQCDGEGVVQGEAECSRCAGEGFDDYGRWCRNCDGQGFVFGSACQYCRGHGVRKTEHSFEVKVPAGMPSTGAIRLREQGPSGEHGGPRGDVLVRFKVKANKSVKLNGLTLTVEAKVDFLVALLGGVSQVDVFGRTVMVKVPAACRAGRLLTVLGEGLAHPGTKEKGDLKVRVILEMPEGARRLTREHKEILRAMFDAAAADKKK